MNSETTPPSTDCVLVVENDPGLLNLINGLLSSWGYDVLAVASLQDAQTLWNTHHTEVTILLSDLTLADGSADKFIISLLDNKKILKPSS